MLLNMSVLLSFKLLNLIHYATELIAPKFFFLKLIGIYEI